MNPVITVSAGAGRGLLNQGGRIMPRISDIALFKQVEQPTLVIRAKVDPLDLPKTIKAAYEKLARYLQELGETMTDVPFVGFHVIDSGGLEMEIGYPVATVLPEKEDMKPGVIPAGYGVFCIYQGLFFQMEPTLTELAQWIIQAGYQATGTIYEHYYDGPDFFENGLLTKIVMEVK
jgi:effector-binding domain-containing protein